MSRQYTVACLAGEGVGAELMAETGREHVSRGELARAVLANPRMKFLERSIAITS